MIGLFKQAFLTLSYCFYATWAKPALATVSNQQPNLPLDFHLKPSSKEIIKNNFRLSPSCLDFPAINDEFDHGDLDRDSICERTVTYSITISQLKSSCKNDNKDKLSYALQLDLAQYKKPDLKLIVTAQLPGPQDTSFSFMALPPVTTEADLCKVDNKGLLPTALPEVVLSPQFPRLGIVIQKTADKTLLQNTLETCKECFLSISHPPVKALPPYPIQESLPFVVTSASQGCVGVPVVPDAYTRLRTRAARTWADIIALKNDRYTDSTMYNLYHDFGITPGLNRTIFTGIYMADNIKEVEGLLKALVPVTAGGCRLKIRHGLKVDELMAGKNTHEEYAFALQLSQEDLPVSKVFTSIASVEISVEGQAASAVFGKFIDVAPVKNKALLNARDYRRRPLEPLSPFKLINPSTIELTVTSFNVTAAFSRIGFSLYDGDGKYTTDSGVVKKATLLLDYSIHVH